MYDLPDNWMCWMHWNHFLDVPQPQPWLSPLLAIACCRDCSPSCTHFPPQIGQAFVHHLIFNQIRSWLSCHAVRGVNGGSCALPSANEKLQSTHGCHFLSCLPQLIWGTEKVWLTRPVRFQHTAIQLGPEPIMVQLLCIWVSVQKQSFPTALSLSLPRGLIVCLSN